MRRPILSTVVALVVISGSFLLAESLQTPGAAYSYALWPGYAVVAALDRVGVIVAFDSSGDLTFQAVGAALAVNFCTWFAITWRLLILVASRRGTTRPA